MKGCVIGAGPAGLYAAKYISEAGIPVDICEKSSELLGNYKYARNRTDAMTDIVGDKNINLLLDTEVSKPADSKYSFYVVASGGIPRKLGIPGEEHAVPALDIVDQHYRGVVPRLGKNVCVLGMGNVSFDVISYIQDRCDEATILSSRSIEEAPFGNQLLREVVEGGEWVLDVQPGEASKVSRPGKDIDLATCGQPGDTRKNITRHKLLQTGQARHWYEKIRNRIKSYVTGAPKRLSLIFRARAYAIRKEGDKLEVVYRDGQAYKSQLFDRVIASAGFIPHRQVLDTDKPVFYVGWCVEARGTIDDARRSALECANRVVSWAGDGHTVQS